MRECTAGKTVAIRQACYLLSKYKTVVVVDTSNEIAGAGDEKHPAIGYARRLPVPPKKKQQDLMLQAVQNHSADVVVVDEIGTREQAEAACTIAEQGVQLLASVHGRSLADVIHNKKVNAIIGNPQPVIFSDNQAQGDDNKLQQRIGDEPAFQCAIELQQGDHWEGIDDLKHAVKSILKNRNPNRQPLSQDRNS
jgi:stage III sporulation protein SpoIIIAA